MNVEPLASTLALVGIVIVVSALLSGAMERSGLPQVAIFLVLGAILGPAGFGLIDITLQSPALYAISILALVLVLFSDAISVDIAEVRRRKKLALLLLGPGTLLPAALIAFAAWSLLSLSPAASAVLGAALASTDPVMLRNLVRRKDIPGEARLALRLESGMNDAALLPIVVLSMMFLRTGDPPDAPELGRHLLGLFLLGPAGGAMIGWVAINVLEQIRRRVGVRRDYESLYALGVAFTAYATAEMAGGSGFLAAFAAGLVIAALDVELCDCFFDYGEATAEMFLLLAFVAFGASLIWSGLNEISAGTVLFGIIALAVRTGVLLPILSRSGLEPRSRRLIAWLGPRGLSTLLLVLLPVFAGLPGSERIFTIAALVVLMSVVLHGGGVAIWTRRVSSRVRTEGMGIVSPAPNTLPLSAPVQSQRAVETPERITLEELQDLWRSDLPVTLLDVRTERSFQADPVLIEGSIRIPPDEAVERVTELRLPWSAQLVAYCA